MPSSRASEDDPGAGRPDRPDTMGRGDEEPGEEPGEEKERR
jgi:hypothetical protein